MGVGLVVTPEKDGEERALRDPDYPRAPLLVLRCLRLPWGLNKARRFRLSVPVAYPSLAYAGTENLPYIYTCLFNAYLRRHAPKAS